MKIILGKAFKHSLEQIVEFIAKDSPTRARVFRNEILEKTAGLSFMPYRCRKNTTLNDERVRDLIYKGYVIVFRINDENIEILQIFKENLPKF